MPGFVLGSIGLIGLWVLVQEGTAGRVADASNILVAVLRRVMSADAAGIGNHSAGPASGRGTVPPAGGGGGRPPKFT